MKKRSLLLLALSAMVMGGCSKSEIDIGSINSSNAISFSTSTDKQTKASVLDNNNVDDYDFGVFAYYTQSTSWESYSLTTPNFMNDQTVTSEGDAWTYSPTKYWPNTSGEMISFFGYMPKNEYDSAGASTSMATTKVITTSESLPSITFRQNMDVTKMTDFTVGQVLDQVKTSEAVAIPFNHVLTRLNFSAKLESAVDTETSVSITGLKLLGSSSTRLFSAATYALASDGTNGKWGTTNSNGGTVYGSDIDVAAIMDLDADSKFTVSTTTTSFLKKDEYLFLIPPYGKNGIQSDSDICLEITYDVVTVDSGIEGDVTITTIKQLTLPIGSLVEGIAYNIVITIGLDEVELEADQTSGWGDETQIEAIPLDITSSNVSDIEDSISEAFSNDLTTYTVNYVGSTDDLTINIEIPADCDNYDMDIIINLPDQTEDVIITVPYDYTGSITIYAPDATVTAAAATTADGATYDNVTVTTAPTTFIIPEGVTVNGLTILGGNVEVYGELSGEVVKGDENKEATTITFMEGSINSTTSIEESITVVEYIEATNGIALGSQEMKTGNTINID